MCKGPEAEKRLESAMFRLFAFLSIPCIVVVNITQYLLHEYLPGMDS